MDPRLQKVDLFRYLNCEAKDETMKERKKDSLCRSQMYSTMLITIINFGEDMSDTTFYNWRIFFINKNYRY